MQDLHEMVWSILNDCRSHGIKLSVVWQPREDARLVRADSASRRFGDEDAEAMALDLDDWGLADMSLPLSLGPPFDWDLFASQGLHRADRWFSRLAQDGAAGADAFAFDWSSLGRCWICPPPTLAIPVLKKAVKERVTGMLCLPAWRAASFWFLVASDGAHANGAFKKVVRGRPRLIARDDILSDTFRGFPTFDLLFLELDAASNSPWTSLKGQGRCLGDCCL